VGLAIEPNHQTVALHGRRGFIFLLTLTLSTGKSLQEKAPVKKEMLHGKAVRRITNLT